MVTKIEKIIYDMFTENSYMLDFEKPKIKDLVKKDLQAIYLDDEYLHYELDTFKLFTTFFSKDEVCNEFDKKIIQQGVKETIIEFCKEKLPLHNVSIIKNTYNYDVNLSKNFEFALVPDDFYESGYIFVRVHLGGTIMGNYSEWQMFYIAEIEQFSYLIDNNIYDIIRYGYELDMFTIPTYFKGKDLNNPNNITLISLKYEKFLELLFLNGMNEKETFDLFKEYVIYHPKKEIDFILTIDNLFSNFIKEIKDFSNNPERSFVLLSKIDNEYKKIMK